MAALLPLAWLLAGAVPAQAAAAVDATLADSRDAPVRLSSFRGKPLILFYEDRASCEQNAPLKRALHQRAEAAQLSQAAHVLGVANVAAYDFWPARGFVLAAIRDVEDRERIQVLVDWKRTLGAAPWRLPEGASSVLLLDAQGRLVHGWTGAVEGPDMEEFFELLGQLVRRASESAAL